MLADEHSQYQHIQVVETEFFGNALILDGFIQLTERDNMGYHEMIVHVPMLAVRKPKRVLIVGGGIGFMYVSNTPWGNGLQTPYPPGVNNYINPEIHRSAFALPEFFRKELHG